MPKPKTVIDDSKDKQLPDVSELKFDGYKIVVAHMQELRMLQEKVGKESDKKKNTPGTGMLGRIDELKAELSGYMMAEGLEGLRYGNLIFGQSFIEDGRKTLDPVALRVELVQAGVDTEIINAAIDAATKTGDGYYRRQLREIAKKEK